MESVEVISAEESTARIRKDHLRQLVSELVQCDRDGLKRQLQLGDLFVTVEPKSQMAKAAISSHNSVPATRAIRLLTHRERQVCGYVVQGFQNSEIGRVLNIAESTVKRHLYNAYNKLGVDSRTQLAYLFREALTRAGGPGLFVTVAQNQ